MSSPQNNGSSPPISPYGAGWGVVSEDVTVPSGAVAKCRRPGVSGLVAAGVLDNVDLLSNLVETKHIKRARGRGAATPAPASTVDVKSLLADPAALGNLMRVVDRVVCYVVLEPSLRLPWQELTDANGSTAYRVIPEAEREAGVVYCDSIPEEDRMFLLNYGVGGTRDVERFRGEFTEGLRALANGQDLPLPTV